MSPASDFSSVIEFLLDTLSMGRPLRPGTNDADSGCEVVDRMMTGGLLGVDDSDLADSFRSASAAEQTQLLKALESDAATGAEVLDWMWSDRETHREAVVALGGGDVPTALLIVDFHFDGNPNDGGEGVARLRGQARGIHQSVPEAVVTIADLGSTSFAASLPDVLRPLEEEIAEDKAHQARMQAQRNAYLASLMRVPVDQLVTALENTGASDPPFFDPAIEEITTVGDWLSSTDFSLLVTAAGDDPDAFLTAAAASMPGGERLPRAWASRVWRVVMLGSVSQWTRNLIDERLAVTGLSDAELDEAWQRTIIAASVVTNSESYGEPRNPMTPRQRAADLALAGGMVRHLADQVGYPHQFAALLVSQWDDQRFQQPPPLVILHGNLDDEETDDEETDDDSGA